MIAISLSDLSLQDEITQKSHAQAIRRRLSELREQLGVRFPVYVLFTKADLIAGFQEYFDTLGKEEREQVWGFTLDLPKNKSADAPISRFDEEFASLLGQLNAQLLEKMQTETDPQRRALVAGFPAQVASMRGVAREFLNEVFQDNRFERRQMLRGVYFTSGTQEGTPIDRLMLGMAQTFGIGRQAIGTGSGTGRSYFLTRLFEGVMFPEAGLVSSDDRVERRYRWTLRAAVTATVLLSLITGGVWVNSFLKNRTFAQEAEQQVKAFNLAAAALPPSPVGDTDLVPVVDALNILRDMPGNPVVGTPRPDRSMTYGLYQGEVIGTQAAQTYRGALNQRLLPRLLVRLEEQISANVNNPDVLYESLKIYLMLGLQGPMNPDLVKEWLRLDWEMVQYPGAARITLRDDLMAHLEALLDQPMQEVALNGPLIEQAQDILSEMPLAQRVYTGIINSNKATSLPKWRLTDIGGPSVKRALVRSSGKPLNDGIEGIFTYDGFNNVFLPEAVSVAKRVQRESWVLGQTGDDAQSQGALVALSRDVLDLYYNDYITRYDQILGDIDIVPLESLSHAVEVTNVLSGPTSPILNILTAVSQETRLTEDRSLLDSGAINEGVSNVAAIEARSVLSVEAQILLEALVDSAQNAPGEPPRTPGQYVEDRFQWLHDLVARPENQPSQMDDLMGALQLVYQELNKMSFSGITTGEGGQALLQFQQAAARIDGPMQRWAKQITVGSSGITSEGTRATINARWQASVLPFCTKALDNRYPFNRRARADVAMSDFAKLFAPGGLIDAFVDENLLKYIDTRSRPWTWKRVNDVDLGISQSVLQQMQYAAEIRDAFFAGAATPAVQFQITPKALDPKAKEVVLEIDGAKVGYSHKNGQPTPVAVTWPGSVGLARITLLPDKRETENSLSKDGPWAWFRLLDAAEGGDAIMNSQTDYRFTVQTHVGLVRKINEDAVLGLPEHSIWLVSDGMGGHEAGDYASRLIADSVATIPLGLDPGARMHALREAIQTAHNAIQTEAARRGGGTIGATVAALLMTTGHFVALWAGDSRIYRLRDGDLQMLTIDHSAVAEYVTAGKMTWDEAEQHPQSNAITRAVGVGEDLEIDKIRGETQSGDRFLICSDGLTKYTTHAMLERVLQENALENVGESLMQIAIAGGGADNISIIIVDVQ
ncbi:Protein phosphatase PrpC [Nymphon striatum]|nr:Protein phosphatase PrpC [Nymphon striatum]